MAVDPNEPYPVTKEHALWFGFIISLFARFESHLNIAVAGILNTDVATGAILIGDMSYRQKRQTVKHLNSTIGVNGHFNKDLVEALDDAHQHSSLRNWIAHATWVRGQRPNSIKPMQLRLRGKAPDPIGVDEEERDYTAKELKAAAKDLDAAGLKLMRVLRETGLLDKVEANIEAMRPLTS